MPADWDIAVKVWIPIITTVLAAIFKRVLEDRPRLILYVTAVTAFRLPPPAQSLPPGQSPQAAPTSVDKPPSDTPDGEASPEATGSDASASRTVSIASPLESDSAPALEKEASSESAPPTMSPAAPSPPRAGPGSVYTHSLVVRNTGRKSAQNVRIGHHVRPLNYDLAPPVFHWIGDVPNGGWEILIPTLVPGEQLQISYLYFPPLTWNQINSYVKSDEYLATPYSIEPSPPTTRLTRLARRVFYYLGIAAAAYLIGSAVMWLIALDRAVPR